MRLADILSKSPKKEFVQVDSFLLGKKGKVGQSVKINVGKIALNYYCKECEDIRTFYSKENLMINFVSNKIISLDCVLNCGCGNAIPVWFLIESEENVTNQAPKVKILKKNEKLINTNNTKNLRYGKFTYLLDKAEQAYNEELGAGAIVYLRKVFEKITIDAANEIGIQYEKYESGNPKNFSQLLTKVDERCKIIPPEFSKDGYKLFKELSNVVHGEYDEKIGLEKFEALYRLVIGILENVKNHKEILNAMGKIWEMPGDGNDE